MRHRSLALVYPLGLRGHRHETRVVQPAGTTRPVLGTSQPLEDDRRAAVYRQWGQPTRSPRQPAPATIDEPLPQRAQTILYHQLARNTQALLDRGATPAQNQPDGELPVPRTEPLGPTGAAPATSVTVNGPSITVRLRR
ncbi:hypothetical protein N8I74_09690 [Chitiniphilus purpureus]|uniref:Uncharacterized protein n=1 Tax=Chitiniphilus purpureus TaxID=2981137 RepID=A0ABY6DU56_9NEIS|nr:hypothetical protein [Chitiniphilus sp. CD1]UXY17258.1 hypothetical protein N8I74_09690 [Chitiniphilus sp. CD1]